MKKNIISCVLGLLVLILMPCYANAGQTVTVRVGDGLDNPQLVGKIEQKLSLLLTEINNAQSQKRGLNFKGLGLSQSVSKSMSMLWENSPFFCTDGEIVSRCIETQNGYQIREIPLKMTPRDTRAFNESDYQEAVVSFSRSGEIESFYLTLSLNLYMNVINSNLELTDLRRRQLILDYVEHFRTAYNQKDVAFLDQVFSDDALIITGKVISQSRDGIKLPDKITYKKQTKTQYLTNLKRVFSLNSYIKVTFDEIKVIRHPVSVNFYGVTLHQGYTSSSYHDEGYVFLLWDFTDEEQPKIHVRTWQPGMFNGQKLPEDDIFQLSDFDI